LPGLHKWQVSVLSNRNHLVEFSENGVNVKYLYGGVIVDEELRRQYYDIFIVSFAFVIYEGS